MICEICKKNKAVVHFINIVNGKKNHQMLCEECALKINNISLSDSDEFKEEFNFNKILSGLFDYMDSYDELDEKDICCENCGRTYKEFKENGICGCSECYKYFGEKFDFLEGKEHIGKIPKGEKNRLENKMKLYKMKKELDILISNEEYEKAAKLRDKITIIEEKLEGEDD